MDSRASTRGRVAALPLLIALLLNLVGGPIASVAVPGDPVRAANEGVDLDQCSNGGAGGPRTACSWQNGNLNGSNSQYREEDSVAFRAKVTNLAPSTTYTLVLQYDTTDSAGRHTYDFLTSWNRTESGDPCASFGCGTAGTAGAIPNDPNLSDAIQDMAQQIAVWGADITSVTYGTIGDHSGANDQNTILITFTTHTDSDDALFAWGGHIASETDWGAGTGAASSPGSSYHMRFQALQDAAGQNLTGQNQQDRSLSADAVLLTPAMTTQVSASSINVGQSVTDLATLTEGGNRGAPAGTVSFFVCGPGQLNPVTAGVGCPSGGTPVGTPVATVGTSSSQDTDDTSTATSAQFTPTLTGQYCFRAQYVPATNDNQGDKAYVGTSHTNAQSECFTVTAAALSVTKTPDEDTTEPIDASANDVQAGDPATFTIVTTNTGDGTATGVTLSDPLPQVEGGWTIVTTSTTWPTGTTACAITGIAPAAQTLTCGGAAGVSLAATASLTVTVTTTTDGAGAANDCGTLANLAATASSTNAASANDSGEIDVLCGQIVVTKTPDEDTTVPIDPAANDVNAGANASFTIVTSNTGVGSATGVKLSDVLPQAENGWAITATTWPAGAAECAISGTAPAVQTLTCGGANGVTLLANGSLSVTVTTATDGVGAANDCGSLVNAAANATTTNDGSGTDAGEIDVLCANIVVSKTPDEDDVEPIDPSANDVNAGDPATFTIVTSNTGAGAATGVKLSDALPQVEGGWTIVTASTTWPTDATGCAITGTAPAAQTLTCGGATGVTLPAAGSLSVTVTTTADGVGAANDCGSLSNAAATATSTNADSAGDSGEIDVLCADIQVTKTPDEDETEPLDPAANDVNAGDSAVFTILTENIGAGEARGVTLFDNLDDDLGTWTIVSDDWATGCTIETGLHEGIDIGQWLSCGPETITAEDSVDQRTVTVSVPLNSPADCGTVTNGATAASTNDGVDSDTGEIDVLCANIVVTKTPDEDTTVPIDLTANDVTAGGAASFTIVTKNTGNGEARGVTLSDLLPQVETGWTVSASTWPEGSIAIPTACTISGTAPAAQTLTCGGSGGVTLLAGGSLSVTVTTTTDGVGAANDCGELMNLAATAGSTNDGSGSDAGEIDVMCPNPSVAKTATPATIVAGDAIAFSITVSGGGTGSAANVTLRDVVPAGHNWTVGGADIGSCSADATTLTNGATVAGGLEIVCSFGTMPSSASRTITLSSASTPTDCAAAIGNTATITAGGDVDTSTASNSSTATVTVQCPNVSVAKAASAATVQAPGTLTYTIDGTNSGAGEARGVVITDDLDDDLTVTSATFDVDPATDGGGGTCTVASATKVITCTIGVLAASDGGTGGAEPDSVRVTIAVGVPTAACGTVTNQSSIGATNETAAASENNQSDVVNVAVLCPDVSVDKSVSSPIVLVGSNATFTITASGGTRGTSNDVTLTDVVPAGHTWTVGGAAIGDCSVGSTALTAGATVSGGQTISCNFGALGANQTRVITVSATPGTASCGGTITNTATVAAGGDSDTTNNSDSAQFAVRCPTLVIDKVASAETITISGPNDALVASPSVVTWTLSYNVTNGPVTGVVITDPIPTGFTFLDAQNGGTLAGGTVTWSLGTVSTSGSVSFRTTVNPTTIPRTGQTNVATIDSTETAPDTGQDGVTVVVQPPPLASTGSPSPTPAPALPNTAALGLDPLVWGLVELLAALAIAAAIGHSAVRVRTSRRR